MAQNKGKKAKVNHTHQLIQGNSYFASYFTAPPASKLVGETEDELIYELVPQELVAQQATQAENHVN